MDDGIKKILRQGEGPRVEFKESPKNLEKDISAFANASGGTIYIGVTDRGEIKPFHLTNKLKAQIQDMASACEPRPLLEINDLGPITSVKISESDSKPVKASDGFYLRLGATSQKLKRDEIFSFAICEGKIRFDTQLYLQATAEKIMSVHHLEVFRGKARLDTKLDPLSFLKNMGCLKYREKQAYLTHGGVLFFTDNPQTFFPQATVTLLHMENPSTILEQIILQGTLLEQVERAFYFLRDHLRKTQKINSLMREDILEMPEFVLRELVVNAVTHRDYFDQSADIAIKIYPNQIEFSNPGIPGAALPIERLYGHSYRRNSLIADLFYRLHYIERAGTGLLRVRESLKKRDLPPLILQEEGSFFVVKLPRSPASQTRTDLNQRQSQLLGFSVDFFPFSTEQYSKYFNISQRMARQDIAKLMRKKLVTTQRHGRKIRYLKRDE